MKAPTEENEIERKRKIEIACVYEKERVVCARKKERKKERKNERKWGVVV